MDKSTHPHAKPVRRHSRRALFTGLAAISALRTAATAVEPSDAPGDIDPSGLLVKLIRRLTYGFSTAELTHANAVGYQNYLEYQLNPQLINDDACTARLASMPTLTMPAFQLFAINPIALNGVVQEAAIVRAIYSKRQLYERMVELWCDHFSIDWHKGSCDYLKPIDDREVIRPNALGNFGTLLRASAHSPAMLEFLDNAYSTASAPNENYARELMELYTLGTPGNFTEQDVREVARCFTGWGYTPITPLPGAGVFRFDPTKHDNGPKVIFANTPQQVNIAPGGMEADGDRVLTALINHPATARFVARKIASWLIRENPPARLVDAVAATYIATNGDIKSMVRAAMQPAFLAAAPPKYKRPFQFIVSCVRAVPTEMPDGFDIRQVLMQVGQSAFERPTPDGYPDSAAAWMGNILPRWNFGFLTAANWMSAVTMDVFSFFGNRQSTPDILAELVDQGIFGGELPPHEKNLLREFCHYDGNLDVTQMKDLVGLAFATPTFQWY